MNRYRLTMRLLLPAVIVLTSPVLGQSGDPAPTDNPPVAQSPVEEVQVETPPTPVADATETSPSSPPASFDSTLSEADDGGRIVTEGDSDVEATDFGTFNLNARDIDLTQILEMLSEVSQRNILAGPDVTSTVSVNLYDVTFDEALHAVLEVGGCASLKEGNFIYVHPRADVEAILEARRRPETRVYELFYISAANGLEIVTPMLTESGTATALGDVEAGFTVDETLAGGDSWAFSARLVVTDFAEVLEDIATTIKELDVPPTQVMVEAAILQAAVQENNAFGIDFSFLANMKFTELTNVLGVLGDPISPLSAVNNLQTGDTRTNHAVAGRGNLGGTGESTFSVGVIADGFSIFLRALDDVTDTTVLARPKVLCLNRQRAKIHVGRDVGYLTSTQTDTSTTQGQEFLPTGIELSFRPFIAPNDMIRMELHPSLSDASQRPALGFNGQNITLVDKTTNDIITNVRVRNGETIALGGFYQEKSTVTRRQVPLLGDIPIAGQAFRGQDDTIDRVEIIFLLTPTIIKDEQLYEIGEESLEIMDTVRMGVRSGLLPWSRDQVTANYNRDALEAYRNGELDLALYYANASLRQDMSQPELHRFREQLTGDRKEHWEKSINRRLLEREMNLIPAGRLDPIAPVEDFDQQDRPVPEPVLPPEPPQRPEATGLSDEVSQPATLTGGLNAGSFGEEGR
jgi:type IV pilus assembly protein PilQ